MAVIIEVRKRYDNQPLLKMPLYEFLMKSYYEDLHPDEYAFEDLKIVIDGKELAPSQCARA